MAKASLKELPLDYKDYLRQRGLEEWPPNHPALLRFKAKRCSTPAEIQAWVKEERKFARTSPTPSRRAGNASVPVHGRPCKPVQPAATPPVPGSAQFVANAALSLLNLCHNLLNRQLDAQAAAFEKEGGFTECLYRIRSQRRKKP